MLLLVVGVLGALTGGFLTGVIHRLRHGPPPVRGATGRPRRRWIALLTAAAFVLVAWRAVQLGRAPLIPALLVFTALGTALAAIDLSTRRLPNVLVLPAYPVLGILVAGAGLAQHDGWAVARAGVGAAALFGFFFLLAVVHPPGMGMGDVKFAGVIGLVLGYLSWTALLVGAFAAFFLGAAAGIVVLATGTGSRKTALPFGPFMVAGALAALWVAGPLGGLVVPS